MLFFFRQVKNNKQITRNYLKAKTLIFFNNQDFKILSHDNKNKPEGQWFPNTELQRNKNLILYYSYISYRLSLYYSGMATSTGRQALLNNRCRSVADSGRSARAPLLLKSSLDGNNISLTFSETLSANAGGEDTNKSFSLWLTNNSLPFSGELPSSLLTLRSGERLSQRGGSLLPPPPAARLSSILRVFLRRRWITGLADGLLVGLPATAHWVASSLNFCRVAILFYRWFLVAKWNPTKYRRGLGITVRGREGKSEIWGCCEEEWQWNYSLLLYICMWKMWKGSIEEVWKWVKCKGSKEQRKV